MFLQKLIDHSKLVKASPLFVGGIGRTTISRYDSSFKWPLTSSDMTSLSIRTFQMKEHGQNYMQMKFHGHCLIRYIFIVDSFWPNIVPKKLKSLKNPQNPKSSAEDPTLNIDMRF